MVAGLPCKNTACKSHGRPHPNCKCYPGMATGGEVKSFCDMNIPHRNNCEYYAEGGMIAPENSIDPKHAVAGYLFHGGLNGILRMRLHDADKAMDIYNKSISKGHKHFDSEVDRIFDGKSDKLEDRSKHEDAIHDWVSKGGVDNDMRQEMYKHGSPINMADGGMAQPSTEGIHGHPIESVYPDQNLMLNEVKSRASNYLASLRPQEHPQMLPFDSRPDMTEQKKTYRRAIKIAAHPGIVLDKANKGTLSQEDVTHLVAIYPELNDILQKKLTEKIVNYQLEGKRPSFKTRQSLSLLMGAALSSEFSPQMILAAQATFQGSQPQQQPGGGHAPAKKTSALDKVSQSLLTADQASASRQQKQ